jgi:hypothetical protein
MSPDVFKCFVQSLRRDSSSICLADRLKCWMMKLFSDLARGGKTVIKIKNSRESRLCAVRS